MMTGVGAESEPSSETGHDSGGNATLVNAVIGAVVTVVTVWVPFSPVIGGGVAGYLQRGSDRDGLRVGALSGLIASIPMLAIVGLVIAVGMLGIAFTGEVAVPVVVVAIVLLVSMFIVGYTVVLSTIGGFAGAATADLLAERDIGDGPGDDR